MPTGTIRNPALAQELLNALDALSGLHPGFRPAHAKGLMCSGTFTPSAEAAKLTRAPHATAPSTPVTVRYSDGTGVPNIPDNDPARSGPRGIAIRFHLGDHAHTDIIAHSTNGFPVRTGEEFVAFLRAVAKFGAGQPEALGAFLAAHPNAQRFVEAPKPIPTSFAREAFFAVASFKFTNAVGVSRQGRFRIRPAGGTEYLSNDDAAAKSANFLFDEIGERLARGPIGSACSCRWRSRGTTLPMPAQLGQTTERLRHNKPDGARGRPDAGPAEDHLRPVAPDRRHRFVRRSAHGRARRHLSSQRAQATPPWATEGVDG